MDSAYRLNKTSDLPGLTKTNSISEDTSAQTRVIVEIDEGTDSNGMPILQLRRWSHTGYAWDHWIDNAKFLASFHVVFPLEVHIV